MSKPTQPGVNNNYDVARRYPKPTPQARRAQNGMPVELFASGLPGFGKH
jgi:hypothetical protein